MPEPDPSIPTGVRAAPTAKRIRALVGGRIVADSERARIVWFGPVARTYAVPREDLRGKVGEASGHAQDPIMGSVRAAPLEHEGGELQAAVLLPGDVEGLDDHVVLSWDAMDAWFEEDEEVYVHPHDPEHRLDILRTSRHVVVQLDGERLAESSRPTLLFETHLPPRYYLPPLDLERTVLEPSSTTTGCAYKGFADYLHARVAGALHEDVAWRYRTSFPEAAAIQGMVAFFQERVDVTVDGELLERPNTPWRRER